MRVSRSKPKFWCDISRPRKRSVILTLLPSSRNRPRGAQLDLVIVILDRWADLDFLDLDDLLFLAGLVGLLLLLVLELAVVHDLADRRFGIGRDFDDVEADILRARDRFADGDNADLLPFGADQADGRGADGVVDARTVIFAGRWHIGLANGRLRYLVAAIR